MHARKFPKCWPDFTDDQRTKFQELKLCPEQVDALRGVLPLLCAKLRKPAAHSDVRARLSEVESLACDLREKLTALWQVTEPAHAEALHLIEHGYWTERPLDDGATVQEHLCPRLHALEDSAREAKATLPRTPARHAKGDPTWIEAIDRALHDGWFKRHGSNTVGIFWCGPDDDPDKVLESRACERLKMPRAEPYPRDKLRPKAKEGRKESAFRAVVSICCEAAGDKSFPKRAMEAFVKKKNDTCREALLALENALSGGEPRDG